MNNKIALCYFGNCGWELDSGGNKVMLHPQTCFNSVNNYIIKNNNNIDIFVHSWSVDQKSEILKTFKPALFTIEEQKVFYDQIDEQKQKNKTFIDRKYLFLEKLRSLNNKKSNVDDYKEYTNRAFSRWYSTKKVIELKKQYETKNNIRYDYVMLLRMDVEFYTNIKFGNYNPYLFYAGDPSNLSFKMHNYLNVFHNDLIIKVPLITLLNKLVFMLYKYPIRNQREKKIFWVQPNIISAISMLLGLNYFHLSDTWFFSGNSIMNKFGLLYDNVGSYNRSPHISSYQHILSIIDNNNLRFPFKQFEDYELYRQGKNTNNLDLIIKWLNVVL
jgi:hypothetical protein